MGRVVRNQTTGMRLWGSHHQRSHHSGFTSLTPLTGEPQPSIKSGSTEDTMTHIDPTVAVDAINLVEGDRNDQYGPPEENLGRIAALWSAFLGREITADEVALMMVLVKISRSRAGYSRDTTVDGVAYFLIHDSMARYK